MDKDAAEHTAKLCAQEGAKTATIVADVRDADACDRLVHDAHDGLGGLDGVVANVGFGYGTDLANTSPEVWDEIFAVNARSHFLVARAALPIVDDGSTIVFVGSAASLKAGTRLPAYDASKAALFGLCRHVALEGAQRGIRANLVVPGPVDTPLGRWASAGMPSRAQVHLPLGRQATAWDVAYATLFLLSGESSYITGQAVVVDGGITEFG